MKSIIQIKILTLFFLLTIQISCSNQKIDSLNIESIFGSNWEIEKTKETTKDYSKLIYKHVSKEKYTTGDGFEERETFTIIEKEFNSDEKAKEFFKNNLTECEFRFASILGKRVYLYRDEIGMSRRSNIIYIRQISSKIKQVEPYKISNGSPIFFSEKICY